MSSGVSAEAYLLLGKEEFLKSEFIRALYDKNFSKDPQAAMNRQTFSADAAGFSGWLSFTATAPFLSDKKFSVLTAIDDLGKESRARLTESLSKLPSYNITVLTSSETSLKKDRWLDELGAHAHVVSCHPPFERDLPGWIGGRARQYGKKIEVGAVSMLMERVGKDLALIAGALESLTVYCKDAPTIRAEDVSALFGRSAEADVFSLIDLLLDNKQTEALFIIDSLLKNGVRALEIVGALAMQFERLTRALEMKEGGGLPVREIAQAFKIPPFHQEKFFRQLERAKDIKTLRRFHERLFECETLLKTGSLNDRMALERWLIGLTNR